MFANIVDDSELFYSNPANHFLGQGNLTTKDSGFNSNQNNPHSGNSKEFACSQDLFSQTQNSDYLNEEENTKSHYHKYIAQKPIFEKFSQSQSSQQRNLKKVINDVSEFSSLTLLEEIRNNILSLNESVKKLNEDLSSFKKIQENSDIIVKNNDEFKKWQNKFDKKFGTIEENFSNIKNFNKLQEDNFSKISELMTENIENIQNLSQKLDKKFECKNCIKIIDKINKIEKNEEYFYKMLQQELKIQEKETIKIMENIIQEIHKGYQEWFLKTKYDTIQEVNMKVNNLQLYVHNEFEKFKVNIANPQPKMKSPVSTFYHQTIQMQQNMQDNYANFYHPEVIKSENSVLSFIPTLPRAKASVFCKPNVYIKKDTFISPNITPNKNFKNSILSPITSLNENYRITMPFSKVENVMPLSNKHDDVHRYENVAKENIQNLSINNIKKTTDKKVKTKNGKLCKRKKQNNRNNAYRSKLRNSSNKSNTDTGAKKDKIPKQDNEQTNKLSKANLETENHSIKINKNKSFIFNETDTSSSDLDMNAVINFQK